MKPQATIFKTASKRRSVCVCKYTNSDGKCIHSPCGFPRISYFSFPSKSI